MTDARLNALIFDMELELANKLDKLMELGRITTTNGVDFTDTTTGEILAIFENGEFQIDKTDLHNASLRMYSADQEYISSDVDLINESIYITTVYRVK